MTDATSRLRRVRIHRPGSYDRLVLEDVPLPEPAAAEVRVTVAAAGVNYADATVRMGLYESQKEMVGWPVTPGFEFAGTVEAVGDGVTDLAIGDAVFGVTFFGAYASHVVVRREFLFPVPDGLTPEQAAGAPAVFLTAWYALCELAHPRPGQTLLVHSAAGGVGRTLVEVGKALGCRVIGVVGGSHKVGTATAAGADVVIDKSREDLWARVDEAAPGGCDVVLDANGVATLWQSFRHLRKPGKLVTYGFHSMLPRKGGRPNWLKLAWDYIRTPRFNPIKLTNGNRSVLAFNLSYLFNEVPLLHEAMARYAGWLAEGRLTPPPVQTFPLDSVADAHRAIESGTTVGKLVLVP